MDKRRQSGTHQRLIHNSIDAKRPLRPIGAIVLRGDDACRGEEVCKHGLGEYDGGAAWGKLMAKGPKLIHRWQSGKGMLATDGVG